MCVVEEGQVEIRILSAGPDSHTRLAAFGPGGTFGEMSMLMLMSQQRTADAV